MPALGFGVLDGSGVAARLEDGSVVDLGEELGEELRAPSLNPFLAAGPDRWAEVRERVSDLRASARRDPADVVPVLPVAVGDYVDFYACEHHVVNMGRLLRPGQPPVLPNWRQLPVGYHGRTSTIVVSGSPVPRPRGLRPTFGPTERLDVEVEIGFVVGTGNERGRPQSTTDAWRSIFGVVVLNDWSARDVQAFEYQPLGPHLGKSFATSISPWVVPLDLLPRVDGPAQDPEPAAYLRDPQPRALDIDLSLEVNGTVVSKSNARHLYWSAAQMLAHMTVNGASSRPGDLFGSGTISGPDPGGEGSLAERGGPFLADGDTVCISSPLLGEVEGRIEPG